MSFFLLLELGFRVSDYILMSAGGTLFRAGSDISTSSRLVHTHSGVILVKHGELPAQLLSMLFTLFTCVRVLSRIFFLFSSIMGAIVNLEYASYSW